MIIGPPAFEELNDYYKTYWKFLSEDDLLAALNKQTDITLKTFSALPSGAEDFCYSEGKWMIKEVAGHLCDTERILSYRALRFSRNDKTPLNAFDENAYMANSNFASRKLNDILIEWQTVRNATISLFSSMTGEMTDRKGTANNVTVTPRTILYFILVHERHHLSVVKERYLRILV
jgi:uncharacterized damage-inducible protein DinB